MPLVDITIRNIRIYDHINFSPHPRINIIVGPNASGKSSILEALSILSAGKSFRDGRLEHVTRHGTCTSLVTAKHVKSGGSAPLTLTIKTENGRGRYTINDSPARLSELAAVFPSVAISSDSHYQFQNLSRIRRSTLDWMLFHVEPSFHDIWVRFQRTLEQRNALLRVKARAALLSAWDQEFCDVANQLSTRRTKAVTQLLPIFQEISNSLLKASGNVGIDYFHGWESNQSLESVLIKKLSQTGIEDLLTVVLSGVIFRYRLMA